MAKTWKMVGTMAAAALLMSVLSARADQEVSFGYEMPIKVVLNVNETGCDNSPGPFITVEGEIALGGLQAQLIFQNNVKGTHRTVQTVGATAVLLPAGGTITIPKQPVLGGVGGNPWIYLQFFNDDGNLTPEILLGRCVQGLVVEQDLLNSTAVSTLIAASDAATVLARGSRSAEACRWRA